MAEAVPLTRVLRVEGPLIVVIMPRIFTDELDLNAFTAITRAFRLEHRPVQRDPLSSQDLGLGSFQDHLFGQKVLRELSIVSRDDVVNTHQLAQLIVRSVQPPRIVFGTIFVDGKLIKRWIRSRHACLSSGLQCSRGHETTDFRRIVLGLMYNAKPA